MILSEQDLSDENDFHSDSEININDDEMISRCEQKHIANLNHKSFENSNIGLLLEHGENNGLKNGHIDDSLADLIKKLPNPSI